jgi:lipoprotein
MRKKIRVYFLVSLAALAVALVGCSSKSPDTAKNALYHKTDVTGPAASFDWNAKVGPVSYEKTYVETNSGKEVTTTLDGVKKAADDLEKKKKEITNPKVQAALKLVDAVFVNQKNFDLVLKARGASNQEEFFDKLWNDVVAPVLSERYATFSKDTVFKYKGESYSLKVYAPMFFKVNTNALGKAGAYTLEDYKIEGDMVYLKFKAPSVDVYQYEVKASYHQDNQEFFQGLIDEHNKVVETNYSKGLIIRFVYQLAALDFKADNYVDLQGMDYYDTSTHYLAIKVDSKGNAKIDKENIANLLQINMKPANEANKGKFE